MVVTGGCGVGGNGEILVRGHRPPVITLVSSGDLMYRIVIIINNTVSIYLEAAESGSSVFSPEKRNGN